MKKKLLVLPLLALTVGMLSGCTKDDIKAIQDHDAEQDSRLDALEGEVAGLKNQISALRTELEGKINDAKSDYQAKIDSANGEISSLKTQLQTLSTNFDSAKAELKADYEAKIKVVDDKLNPLKEELLAKIAQEKGALNDLITGLRADLDQLSEDYAIDVADLQGQIDSISSGFDALLTSLDTQFTSINDQFDAVGTALNNLISAFSTFQTNLLNYDAQNDDMVYAIFNIAYSFSMDVYDALGERCDAIEAQEAEDIAALQEDYNAKITALTNALSSAQQEILDAIDNLQGQIDDLNDELNEYILLLQDDYQSQINEINRRIGILEDVPVYTVTFDPNYDFFNGDIAEPIEVEVLQGEKLEELDPSRYVQLDRPGNNLVQWNYGDTNKEWVFFGYPVTEDMTLTAQWEANDEEHIYDFANGFTFARETLDQNGHVRYRCTEHGDACYFETQEKAGLLYVEDTFSLARGGVRYTAITGKVVQGRIYKEQEVTIQLASGLLKNYTIESIEMFAHTLDVAVAGDNVGLLFKEADLAKSELVKGGLVCKAGEAKLYGRGNECLFHLYSEDEQAMYPDLGINARHTPIFDGYRPTLKLNSANRTIQISIIDSDSEEMIKPGEDGIVKFDIPNVSALTFFEKYDANFAKVDVYEGSNLIGYLDIDMREADMALLACGNTENTFVKPLYPDHTGDYAGSYYLPDDDQFFDDIDGWNELGGYPPFQRVMGYSKDPNSTNPEYEFGGYADSDVSFNVYFIWEYQATLIFDGVAKPFDYEDRGTSGMALTAELVQDAYFKTGNAGTKVNVYYSDNVGDSYYDGYRTESTFIDIIEVNGAQYLEEYEAKAGQEVTLCLRNIDESIMEKFLGLAFDTTITAYVSPNKDHGGVNPDGQVLRSFTVRQYNYLPTMDQYVAPTRRLLGFSADPNATTATYAPGEYYRGRDTQLYAIWGEPIFSFAASSVANVPGRGVVLQCAEVPADIEVGAQIYVQLNDGTIATSVITGIVVKTASGSSIVGEIGAGALDIGFLTRGLEFSKVSEGTFCWAK